MVQGTRLTGTEKVWLARFLAMVDIFHGLVAGLWGDTVARVFPWLAALPMVALHGVITVRVASSSCRLAGVPMDECTAPA